MLYSLIKPFLLVFLLSLIPGSSSSQHGNAFNRGASSYDHLRSKAEDNSEEGSCMKNAFSQLNSTCSNLDETTVKYLALKFTVCHFLTLQRELPGQCLNATLSLESIAECTKELSEVSFSIYTQFYTHTHSACYFLQSRLWQERTQLTIEKLGDVAAASADIIEESLANSETLIKGQDVLQSKASELSDKHDHLHDKMDTNHQKMDALTKSISEHYNTISDMLQVLRQSSTELLEMVTLVLGETQQLSSFLFYFTLTLMTFLLTIPSRTNGARLRMLSFIVLHFMLERLAFTVVSGLRAEYTSLILTATYYTRFFTVLMLSFLLVRTGYNYRDYGALLTVISTKLDEERSENQKFREVIQNEIKVNSASLQDKFDRLTLTQPFASQEEEQLVPHVRRSIHCVRKRLEDGFDTPECVSDYNTPWLRNLSDEPMFSPMVTLDYDSGVEDCSRRELQLSIHKLNVSTAGSSSASTPTKSVSSKSMTSSTKRYNLRSNK